jgi:TPR repeat protein
MKWYQSAAALDNAWAQYKLGEIYAKGDRDIRNPAVAAVWYQRAAMAGNPYAQMELGDLYANGRGVQRDMSQAAKWYELSAAQDNAWAQMRLAGLYLQRGCRRVPASLRPVQAANSGNVRGTSV